MRILVVSDLHYRLPHYDWLLGAAERVDAVALVGDLADVVSPVPHDVQTVVVTKYLGLLAERTRVFAASGQPRPRRARCPRGAGRLLAAAARSERPARGRELCRHRGHEGDRLSVVGRTRRPGRRSPPSSPRRRSTGPPGGSGSTTRRRPARSCATTAGVPSRTRTSRTGSPSTRPTSSSAATSTRRRGPRTAPGTPGSATPGCSTPARRSGRCPPTSPSTWRRGRPTGSASTSRGRSTSVEGPVGQWSWSWSPSGSRAEPVVLGGAWWWTSWSRIWSTIPRCPPASENCCFTSTR